MYIEMWFMQRCCFRYHRVPLCVLLIVIVVIVIRAFVNISSGEVTMLTFNIWNSNERIEERMDALGQVVEDLQPDFLVFQEISPVNLPLLEKQRWFSKYRLTPPKTNLVQLMATSKSCAVILSHEKYIVESWQIYLYQHFAKYRRALVTATLSTIEDPSDSKNVRLVLGGTHLAHDVPRALVREQQLKEALQRLSLHDNVCLMGDLNIVDEVDGEVVLPSPWIDAWLSISGNTHNKGYTISLSTSPFASVRRRNGTTSGRLDRVLCKLSGFEVTDVRVVGDKLTDSGILPSDHFGVFAVIRPLKEANKKFKPFRQIETDVYFKRPPKWRKLVESY